MLAIHRILHPTDFSAHSACAFQLACPLARDYGAPLVVAHVGPPPAVYGEPPMGLLEEFDPEALRLRLEDLRPFDPAIRVERRLLEGDTAQAILDLAQATGCDLIVMGTHGRTGLPR